MTAQHASAPAWSARATSASSTWPRCRRSRTSSWWASPTSIRRGPRRPPPSGARKAFESLEALVEAGANVIHVLTPPSAHAKVAIAALERGCHVLVEKPMAESVEDARRIGELAREKGLVARVDHSLLYDPQIVRALEQVRSGAHRRRDRRRHLPQLRVPALRGRPAAAAGTATPATRCATSAVHCLYLIQELLGPIEDVDAEWRSLGGDPNLAFDEWRALVRCRRGLGQFQLSWNTKPMQSQMIIHGTSGVLRVDLFAMFHGRRSSTPLPKAAERLVNAFAESLRPLVDVPVGAWKFVRKEIQAFQGLRDLVADFYARLAEGQPPPVSVEEAAEVVHWVEKVAVAAEADQAARLARFSVAPTADSSSRARRARSARRSSSGCSSEGKTRARIRAPHSR